MTNDRNLFFHGSGVQKSKRKEPAGSVLVRNQPLVVKGPLLTVPYMAGGEGQDSLLSLLTSMLTLLEKSPTLRTSLNPNDILTAPPSKHSHTGAQGVNIPIWGDTVQSTAAPEVSHLLRNNTIGQLVSDVIRYIYFSPNNTVFKLAEKIVH